MPLQYVTAYTHTTHPVKCRWCALPAHTSFLLMTPADRRKCILAVNKMPWRRKIPIATRDSTPAHWPPRVESITRVLECDGPMGIDPSQPVLVAVKLPTRATADGTVGRGGPHTARQAGSKRRSSNLTPLPPRPCASFTCGCAYSIYPFESCICIESWTLGDSWNLAILGILEHRAKNCDDALHR